MTGKNDTKRKKLSDVARKILKLLHKDDQMIDSLSRDLNISKEALFEAADELRKVGYRVSVADRKKLILDRGTEDEGSQGAIHVSEVRRRYKIAFLSDVRMGTSQAQISLLHWLYKKVFEHENVDLAVMVGGLLVGKPTPSLKPDVLPSLRDVDNADMAEFLVNYATRHYPKTDKFKTYIVSSPRESRLKTEDGLDLLSAICQERPDFKFGGEIHITLDVRGILIKAVAPWDDNAPLGVSYGVQKNTEKIADEKMPHIVVYGGCHERSEIPDYGKNGTYVYTTPSLHTQMLRQERRGVLPRIGCLILELNFNEDGTFDFNTGLRAHHISLDAYAKHNDCTQAIADIPPDKLNADERKMVEWFTAERKISEGTLSRRLGKSKDAVREYINHLNDLGCNISFPDISKQWELAEVEKDFFRPLDLKYDDVFRKLTKFADISDTHFGSLHDCPEGVLVAMRDAAASGARRVFHAGDGMEGPGSGGYRGHQNDVRFASSDDVEDYAVAKWPKLAIPVNPAWPLMITELSRGNDGELVYKDTVVREGHAPLQCSCIDGNHDGWETMLTGRSPMRSLSLQLPHHLHYIGTRRVRQAGSYFFDNVFHRLIHPRGGLGYTLSTKLQKHLNAEVRRNENRGKPMVVHLGHWHVSYLLFRDALGVLDPCFKSLDEFHATLGLMPSIGMFIFELYGDKNGKLTRVISDYRNYRHLAP